MGNIKLFESKQIRSVWNEEEQKWYFSIIDIIEILTGTDRPRKYWSDLKAKLKKEGSELSEKIGQLKMEAEDGKTRLSDVADTKQLLRLIQSIPSPKAEPFKRWLAQVGSDRLDEIENPELAAQRRRKFHELICCKYILAKAPYYLYSIATPLKAWQLNFIVHGFSQKIIR